MKKAIIRFGLAVLGGLPVFAQAPQQQFIEEEKRAELDRSVSYNQDAFIDFGGWQSFQVISFDDDPGDVAGFEDRRTLRLADTRLWASFSYKDIHRIYARGLFQYTDFNDGTQYKREEDVRGPNLDQGFYEFNWSSLTQDKNWGGYLRLGRQFLTLGRGVLFSNVQDGAQLQIETKPVDWKVFGSRPTRGTDDFDATIDVPNHSRRYFIGTEMAFPELISRQRFYLMGLFEMDDNPDGVSISPGADFEYDTWYAGAGARGSFLSNTLYQAEVAYQGGQSTATGTTTDESIHAWYGSFLFEYFPKLVTRPRFAGEWLFGSGDEDRGSVTNTTGGNAVDTDDENFLQFGFAQTGFSLFPRLSNIHVFRASASFFPFQPFVDPKNWTGTFERFEVGSAFYFYRKHKSGGVTSDPRMATSVGLGNDDSAIGTELDVFIRWRILSDLSASFNWGYFMPGDAYDSSVDSKRSFLSAGATLTF